MVEVDFEGFYRYDELTALLRTLADEHEALAELSSIGRSYEGREQWLVTITNSATGPAEEKPGMWVDANIHATELAGGVAALHLVHHLLSSYGRDPRVTRVLDTRVFYVVPRLNPDGVEAVLGDRPRMLRSSMRPYPFTDQRDGLVPEDLDGDGRILTMRIPDPNGHWKVHPDEPRLMVAREPDEESGQFYRLLTEGKVQNYDGVTVRAAPPLAGLDINRNYPAEWRPENEQTGAGPYPASEPEIRNEVDAILSRPNICAFLAYHTYAGVHLRPYAALPDTRMPRADLELFKDIAERAKVVTGYETVSIYHGFVFESPRPPQGGSIDWAYDHLGQLAWATELWSPQKAAGLDIDRKTWGRRHPVEDDLALLRWNDEVLGGQGFVPWYPFDHPQFGEVEIGGWHTLEVWGNPPPGQREHVVAPHSDLAVLTLALTPRLTLHSTEVVAVGDGGWRIRIAVQNSGWLPTNVTAKAVERRAVRPVEAEISVPETVEVIGERRYELGQLTGRSAKPGAFVTGAADVTTDRAKAEWLVRGPAGVHVSVEARHARAGVVRVDIPLAATDP